ncbi:bacteriocin ABC transporter [Spiroplasma syrphidicola EA-1]|uniref:Bacteriocin ABC transporter n=1 Tax=Spiroplasma syrphidicola EA-1 TaxID=1276229 RepID=R4U453_9MOLU|nr:cysteine peptidase family C39 domain-containing protein [Spiroplasma syrphidicola]AGM26222.1 bacteriocin ABC transporter [Spiroplasma syrphidicola EA-1]
MIYPFLKQESRNDCGFACLGMLIEYYHQQKISLLDLKMQYYQPETALSIYDLGQLANKYQLTFTPYQITNQEFLEQKIDQPLIAYVKNENGDFHYIIIYEKKGQKYLMADPSSDKVTSISSDDFLNIFQGIIIFTKKANKWVSNRTSFFSLFVFLKPYRKTLCAIFTLTLLLNLSLIFSKSFLKVYFDQLTNAVNNDLGIIFIAFIIILLFRLFVNYFTTLLNNYLNQQITKKLLCQFISNFNQLSYQEVIKISRSNWIKLQEDLALLATFLGSHLSQLLVTFLMFLISFFILLIMNSTILIIVLIENILSFLMMLIFLHVHKYHYQVYYNQGVKLQNHTLALYDSFLAQRGSNLTGYCSYQWEQQLNIFLTKNFKLQQVILGQNLLQSFLSQIISYIIFYFSFTLIFHAVFSIGDLLFYSALAIYMNDFIISNSVLIVQKTKFYDAFIRTRSFIFKQASEQNEIVSLPTITSLNLVELSYANDAEILFKNVTLTFSGHLFVKGRSGIGKTTLLLLLSKMLLTEEGEIRINNNYNLTLISPGLIATKIYSLVQQQYLFAGTVYDNITNFNQGCNYQIFNFEEIQTVFHRNQIKLTTLINANEPTLSKGQIQIINFIKMLGQDRDVYLIDEGLSNVDNVSKKLLIQFLLKLKRNKVIIYAGHDLMIEQCFEQIIDLEREFKQND